MLVRAETAARELEFSLLPERSSSSNLLANGENVLSVITSNLFPSSFKLVRL